jgi:hypothetical protein
MQLLLLLSAVATCVVELARSTAGHEYQQCACAACSLQVISIINDFPCMGVAVLLCFPCSREYRVWDAAEENALKAGVKKHGLGAWERIRTDPEFTILM